MIGIQGSGKSTFCVRYLAGLVRVNLDTLKTRNNEKRLIDQCFEKGVGFIADNTNPTRGPGAVHQPGEGARVPRDRLFHAVPARGLHPKKQSEAGKRKDPRKGDRGDLPKTGASGP